MTMLTEALQACVPLLPEAFRADHQRLFHPEHLHRLAARLLTFAEQGVPPEQPPPHFAAECTPPLSEPWAFFREPVARWRADGPPPRVLRDLADAFAAAGCGNVLLLLGQRRTPASLTD